LHSKKHLKKNLKQQVMKLQSNNLLEKLTITEINQLTFEVKETIAKDFGREKKRNFTVAQFWNIERSKRNFAARRNVI